MLLLLSTALAVISCMLLAVLRASVWLSAISLVISMGGIALWIFRKKLPRAAVLGGGIACILIAAVILVPAGKPASAIRGYTEILEEAELAVHEGKYEQAQLLIQKVEDVYGSDDTTIALTAARLAGQMEYGEALAAIEQLTDTSSRMYYSLKEQIYMQEDPDAHIEDLCILYIEAAQKHPDWTYMKKRAGIAQMQQKNYASAVYYLEEAVLQDPKDAESYYYLGAANYYRNDYETAQSCFVKALEYDLPEVHASDLLWYLQQMEITEQEGLQ